MIIDREKSGLQAVRLCQKSGLETIALFGKEQVGQGFLEEATTAICIGAQDLGEGYVNASAVLTVATCKQASLCHIAEAIALNNPALLKLCHQYGIACSVGSPKDLKMYLESMALEGISTIKENDKKEALWQRCERCHTILHPEEVRDVSMCCPVCHHYLSLSPDQRLELVVDRYEILLETLHDVLAIGWIEQEEVVICILGQHMSMGVVNQAMIQALERQIPVVVISEGERYMEYLGESMDALGEGLRLLKELGIQKLPYISVSRDVSVSNFKAQTYLLGDIILAESHTINQELLGYVDQIVSRPRLKEVLKKIVELHAKGGCSVVWGIL